MGSRAVEGWDGWGQWQLSNSRDKNRLEKRSSRRAWCTFGRHFLSSASARCAVAHVRLRWRRRRRLVAVGENFLFSSLAWQLGRRKGVFYSFSRSCPKTVSRTREVFPTGSTTLLRLQLWRARDCAHRSRHVGLLLIFVFFFWRERCLPKVSWKSNPAAPGLANHVWPFKSALYVPGKTLMVGWGLLANASRGHLRWSVEGWACLRSLQLKGLYDRTRETHS